LTKFLKLHGRAAFLAALLAFAGNTRADWEVLSTAILGTPAEGVSVIETNLERNTTEDSARLFAIIFDNRSHTLSVVDSPKPGKSRLSTTLESRQAIGGVNGGYFEPDFKPVGLVVAEGKTRQKFKTAKILTGIVATSPNGGVSIFRSNRFDPEPGAYSAAIQCGPMLLEDSAPLEGLNSQKIARRTAVATGPGQRCALIYLTSVTLADAAEILALPKILGAWAPTTALNLDGGSSSTLWARNIISLPEIKRVRNFLEVVPRQSYPPQRPPGDSPGTQFRR
jgi:uncharacterized protein YigE (DUF2233 family)